MDLCAPPRPRCGRWRRRRLIRMRPARSRRWQRNTEVSGKAREDAVFGMTDAIGWQGGAYDIRLSLKTLGERAGRRALSNDYRLRRNHFRRSRHSQCAFLYSGEHPRVEWTESRQHGAETGQSMWWAGFFWRHRRARDPSLIGSFTRQLRLQMCESFRGLSRPCAPELGRGVGYICAGNPHRGARDGSTAARRSPADAGEAIRITVVRLSDSPPRSIEIAAATGVSILQPPAARRGQFAVSETSQAATSIRVQTMIALIALDCGE
jgi:hypothetical protein